MATLTSTETFEFPVDRQDLFNLWANATIGTFPKSEMDESVFTMDVATSLTDATSSPQPGHLLWSLREGLMYVFHDEVDDTGVSLWLAIGPDRFDVAAIVAQPLAAGAVVEPLYDRWVQAFTGASGRPERVKAMGTVAHPVDIASFSGTGKVFAGTTPSGAWVGVSIDGLVWGSYEGSMEADRWIRAQDGTPGKTVKTEQPADPRPLLDDVFGMGIVTQSGAAATAQACQFIWTGPRVFLALQ